MKKSIIYCSLLAFSAVIGDAVAGIRVGNLSRNYAGSSKNIAATEQQYYNSMASTAQDVPVEIALPVPVANAELAEQIKSGDSDARADMDSLGKCAMIYPDGEFIWDTPTMGRMAGRGPTCVAVVEIRQIKASGSREYTSVARGKIAAGDSIRCNISDFPESSYLPAISDVIFPADNEPTREDVINVMNEEQKSKAGLKIAAAAVIGGLGGNLMGKSKPGEDKLLGTNKEKLKSSAIGAAAGAAIMAASTYSGKVAGDVILHSTVNAAAGGVVGNIAQSGDSILRVENCTYKGAETTCLWGTLQNTTDVTEEGTQYYAKLDGKDIFSCAEEKGLKHCKRRPELIAITVGGEYPGKYDRANNPNISGWKKYYFNADGDITQPGQGDNATVHFEATVQKKTGSTISVLIPNFKDSTFGTSTDAFATWKQNNKGAKICERDASGNPKEDTCGNVRRAAKSDGTEGELFTLDDFNPKTIDADDGSVIDLSNKARLGSTLKGAGVGGAMGAFSGYQGAQSDIEERFIQARSEYRDSLQTFYCGTGQKFISFYNDDATIPAMGN